MLWNQAQGSGALTNKKTMYFTVNYCAIDTSVAHIRPRFKIALPERQEVVMARFDALLKEPMDGIRGKRIGDHIVLNVARQDVHYWSPQLNFRIEQHEKEPDSTVVAGLIGPRPEVWTMFVFIYFVIGVGGFFISSYGVVEYTMGRPSNFIYGFPLTILLLLSAYRVSKYGESLAADQMLLLREFVHQGLK